MTAPGPCTDPSPIHVNEGSEQHHYLCGTCMWRTPRVADRASAHQHFTTEHGATT